MVTVAGAVEHHPLIPAAFAFSASSFPTALPRATLPSPSAAMPSLPSLTPSRVTPRSSSTSWA